MKRSIGTVCLSVAFVLILSAFLSQNVRADTVETPDTQVILRGFQNGTGFPENLSVGDSLTVNYTEEDRSPLDNYTTVPNLPGIGGPPSNWQPQIVSPFCTPMYVCVSDSNWATYIFNQISTNNPVIFGMTDIDIPTGFIDIDVTERISCSASGPGTGAKVSHYVFVGGGVDEGSSAGEFQCVDGAATNHTFTMETAPFAEEWSNSLVNDMQCGVKTGDDVSPFPRVHEISCVVSVFYESGFVLELYYVWESPNTNGGQLCVWAWREPNPENIFVQVFDGIQFTTRIVISAQNNPEVCSDYTLLSSEVFGGEVTIRFIGSDETSADTVNTTLLLDRVTLTQFSPSVTTQQANAVTSSGAKLNGVLNSKGSAVIVRVYFQWGETPGTLLNSTSLQSRTITGSFFAFISGLEVSQTYYFRAVANGVDNVTGAILSFTTTSSGEILQRGIEAVSLFIYASVVIFGLMGAWWIRKKRGTGGLP